jgi:cytochrome c biogenesis protein CcdA
MLRVLGLVVTIALGDSLNPTTIAPALYVGSGDRPRIGVLEFTVAVFAVHFLGGLVIVVGLGQLLLALLHDIGHTAQHVLEIVAGAAMLVAGTVLWRKRHRLAEKDLPGPTPKRKSSLLLGAGIIAVELPTAFPYFAAIAATLGSGRPLAQQIVLVGVYNLCFVLPLMAILVTLLLAGEHASQVLTRGREAVERGWPVVFAALLVLGGIALCAFASLALGGR